MKNRIFKWSGFFFFAFSLSTASAIAESNCPSDDRAKYCYCIYEQALDDMKEMQGNTQATIKQRVSAVKKALEQCLGGSSDKAIGDIGNIKSK